MPVYTMYNVLRIIKIASLVFWMVDTCAVLFDWECLHNIKKNWILYTFLLLSTNQSFYILNLLWEYKMYINIKLFWFSKILKIVLTSLNDSKLLNKGTRIIVQTCNNTV